MTRRDFTISTSLLVGGLFVPAFGQTFPDVRTPKNKRNFNDNAIEDTITRIKAKCADKEIAWLFENCFPNTLDTTVQYSNINGVHDTFVITGDIDAMWLRDSTAQVWPYLPLVKQSENLENLIHGVINLQIKCILFDPYANAFYKDNKVGEWSTDFTEMKPGIHERKWEIDSLCYPVRLSYGFWKETSKTTIFTEDWKKAAYSIYNTFVEQQRKENDGPYRFGRNTAWSTDTVPGNGWGNPTRKVGLIHSIFRPSDDATIFPFLIPANFFAVEALKQIAEISEKIYNDTLFSKKCLSLAMEVSKAINKYAIVNHPQYGKIYAMEVDGFGNVLLQDDANVPNLLSLAYLGAVKSSDSIYKNTRKFILSEDNPYFFKGKSGEGIGSPHTLVNQIWHIGIVMRGLTSNSDAEILQQLSMIKKSHADTGFMHESFDKDDAFKFTRKWFAWANTLFGELILKIEKDRPHLLQKVI